MRWIGVEEGFLVIFGWILWYCWVVLLSVLAGIFSLYRAGCAYSVCGQVVQRQIIVASLASAVVCHVVPPHRLSGGVE